MINEDDHHLCLAPCDFTWCRNVTLEGENECVEYLCHSHETPSASTIALSTVFGIIGFVLLLFLIGKWMMHKMGSSVVFLLLRCHGTISLCDSIAVPMKFAIRFDSNQESTGVARIWALYEC